MSNTEIPASATSYKINLTALASFLLCIFFVNQTISSSNSYIMLLLLTSWTLPLIVLETVFFKRFPQINTRQLNITRSLYKLLGLYATIALYALVYWVFDEYHGSFYDPYWEFLRLIGPWVLIAAIPYIYLVDSGMQQPRDGYYHFGNFLLRRHRHYTHAVVWQHLLGWLVKAFFLPLMLVYFSGTCKFFVDYPVENIFQSFRSFYDFAWELIFGIDLAIVCVGYMMTLKVFDSHIRSTEPTLGGWLCAIICYQPFWSLISAGYLAYNKDNYSWGAWLGQHDVAYVIWGSMILVLISIYSLSSVAFGLRFSNLTHRGILTNGPYRYSKHPAYISKNLSWWLIAIPFITNTNDSIEALRNMSLLCGLNLIYYARARTEERHLSKDPVYRQYMLAMEEHSLVAKLRKMLLALTKRQPSPS